MAVHITDLKVSASFHYEVIIDGATISFQECSGLTLENEKIEYRHSNSPVFSKEVRIGLTKMPDITFKKGVFEGDSNLIDLFNKTFDKAYMSHVDERFDVSINLLDLPRVVSVISKTLPVAPNVGATLPGSVGAVTPMFRPGVRLPGSVASVLRSL